MKIDDIEKNENERDATKGYHHSYIFLVCTAKSEFRKIKHFYRIFPSIEINKQKKFIDKANLNIYFAHNFLFV